MNPEQSPSSDVVALVADTNLKQAVEGLLTHRSDSLGIRHVTFRIFVHPAHDAGCLLKAESFLRSFSTMFQHALVLHDREGCGREDLPCEQLETEIETRLRRNGWGDRAAAIVIDPELEAWVWSDSPQVCSVLGWAGSMEELRVWLRREGFLSQAAAKPTRPKEAVEALLRLAGQPRSSSVYRTLSEQVGLARCQDRAFLKLRSVLSGWFRADTSHPPAGVDAPAVRDAHGDAGPRQLDLPVC
jgi:hypothetical protein